MVPSYFSLTHQAPWPRSQVRIHHGAGTPDGPRGSLSQRGGSPEIPLNFTHGFSPDGKMVGFEMNNPFIVEKMVGFSIRYGGFWMDHISL